MTEYIITTDSDSMTIDASSADEAVAIYTGRKGKGGPATLDAIISRTVRVGVIWLIANGYLK